MPDGSTTAHAGAARFEITLDVDWSRVRELMQDARDVGLTVKRLAEREPGRFRVVLTCRGSLGQVSTTAGKFAARWESLIASEASHAGGGS